MKLELLDKSLKNPQISNFMKILPLGAELFDAYRWTENDETKDLCNSVNTLRN
jgi:hypothetical protein